MAVQAGFILRFLWSPSGERGRKRLFPFNFLLLSFAIPRA
jgi:hypothetical protein